MSDPSDLIWELMRVATLDDGSHMITAHLTIPHTAALEELLASTVVHRLGLGSWLDGPLALLDGPNDWRWGGRYLPQAVAIPDDASGLDP